MSGTLYLIATPLGNAEDLSPRARQVLTQVDCVYCEDTRTSGRLFSYLNIQVRSLRSMHAHNEEERSPELIRRLSSGENLAVVSDAGTPGISDPGARAVAAAHDAGFRVSPIVGANAVSALLSVSGVPGGGHKFLGFLPKSRGARRRLLEAELLTDSVVVLFVPMREMPEITQLIADLSPQSIVVLGRELTKAHEEVLRLPASEMAATMAERERLLGESSLVVWVPSDAASALSEERSQVLKQGWKRLVEAGLSRRDATEIVAELAGLHKGRIKSLVQDP